jgi:hypothetical protein
MKKKTIKRLYNNVGFRILCIVLPVAFLLLGMAVFSKWVNKDVGYSEIVNCGHVICRTIESANAIDGKSSTYRDSDGNTRIRQGNPVKQVRWIQQQSDIQNFHLGGHADMELADKIVQNSGSDRWSGLKGSGHQRLQYDKDGNIIIKNNFYDRFDNFGDQWFMEKN